MLYVGNNQETIEIDVIIYSFSSSDLWKLMLLDDLIKSGLRNVPSYFSDLKCVYWSLSHSNTHLRHHAKNLGTLDEDQDALQSTMIFSNILPDTWGKLVGAAD